MQTKKATKNMQTKITKTTRSPGECGINLKPSLVYQLENFKNSRKINKLLFFTTSLAYIHATFILQTRKDTTWKSQKLKSKFEQKQNKQLSLEHDVDDKFSLQKIQRTTNAVENNDQQTLPPLVPNFIFFFLFFFLNAVIFFVAFYI